MLFWRRVGLRFRLEIFRNGDLLLLWILKLSLKLLLAANSQVFVGQAPVVIVACAITDGRVMSCGQLCYPIDIAIALDHISLVAVEYGLGTC